MNIVDLTPRFGSAEHLAKSAMSGRAMKALLAESAIALALVAYNLEPAAEPETGVPAASQGTGAASADLDGFAGPTAMPVMNDETARPRG